MISLGKKSCKYCNSEIDFNSKVCPKCQKDLRNWFIRHWIVSILLFIFIGIPIISGFLEGLSGNKIIEEQSKFKVSDKLETINSESQQKIKTIKIKAISLYSTYKANEIKADNLYKNKNLEVSGIVDSIGKDIFDNPYVSLKGGDYIFSIQCMLESSEKATELNKGQNIVVIGRNSGKMGNILLDECIIK